MALFFDAVDINNKIVPIGSKSYINHNSLFNSTTDDVFIALYPNNCNDFNYDNYDNYISFGSSNLKDYYEGYISTKKNKLIKFNDYNIITNIDIIPDNSYNSFGNVSNTFYSIYMQSNIYLNNISISSETSNIFIYNDLLINNLNILENIFTNYTISSNIYTSNLFANFLYTSNIYNKDYITTSNLILNILLAYNCSYINKINTYNVYTDYINSSNIFIYDKLLSDNITTSNIESSYIFSSNLYNLHNITTNSINIGSNSFIGNIIIDSDIVPSLNDYNNIGSDNYKFSNVYIYDNIISDYNKIFTSFSNIVISNNFVVNNAYSININANNLSAHNIYTNGSNIFNNIINDNNIYSDIIFTSNLSSLDSIISSYINVKNIYTNQLTTSNINILGLIYSKSIESENILSDNLKTSNLNTNELTTLNLNILKTSFINTLISYNDILLQKNNIYDLGSSNNTWNSLYISSNIFIDKSSIISSSSNILFNNNLYTCNLYISNINTDNLFINNIQTSITNCCNIITKYTYTDTIYLSNIVNYKTIRTQDLYTNSTNNIDTIFTSNLYNFSTFYANILSTSNIDTKDIIVNDLKNYNIISIPEIYVTSNSYINKIIIPEDLNPSYCNHYNLGSINKKWKDAYLTGNTVHIGDISISIDNVNSNSIYINNINNSNIIEPIILSGISFINEKNNLYANININNKGFVSLNSSNKNKGSLSYNIIKDEPLYSYCNFILNNITSSNATFYNNLSINTNSLDNSLNTLIINGTTISKYFIGSYIGHVLNISNILSKNLINNLIETNGAIILPKFTFNNNKLETNNINSTVIQSSYIGDGNNIYNISSSNIKNILPVYNSGFGCNTIKKNSIIVGNNSNSIIVSSKLTFDNINNILNINGLLNVDNINIDNLIITCNIFHGNASNIRNIISSNIKGILPTNNGSLYYNIFSNLKWSNKTINIEDNLFVSNNIYSKYYGNGINISNIISSNLIYKIDINQGGINSNYYTFGTINLDWTDNKLIVKNNIKSKNLISYFEGNGENIYNLNASSSRFINDIIDISQGGLSNDTQNLNEILLSGSSSSNLIFIDNNMYINGKINSHIIKSSKFISSGENISNIFAKNIVDNVSIENGGTLNNKLQMNGVIFSDNNNITTSSNLYWNKINNNFGINGSVSVNNYFSPFFYGNGENISNVNALNLNNNSKINVNSGGTGNTKFKYGNLLFGNNNKSILDNYNLNYSNHTLYSKQIYSTYYYHNNLFSYKLYGNFIGSGINISNILSHNIIDKVGVSNGGTGLKNIVKGELLYTSSNIIWNNNKLKIENNLYANLINSYYHGDSINISNIYASNIINKLKAENGGLINYLNYYPISWNNLNYKLSVNKGSIYTNETYSLYYGNAINISNIFSSNLIYKIQNINGSINNLYFNKGINFFENNSSISINISSLNAKNIYNNIYYGDGKNISNIKNINNELPIYNGGLNRYNIIKNFILYGDNDNISISSNLYWDNNTLFTNNIECHYINSKYSGDGTNISNLNSKIFKGEINTNIKYYSNLVWNNKLKKLIINGNIYNNEINTSVILGDGINISNINAKNIISKISLINGGYNNISNIKWLNNVLNIDNKIYAYNYYSKYIGSGNNISNIQSSNLLYRIENINGGIGLSNILINSIITSDGYVTNILWENNTLFISDNISSKNIVGQIIGDGKDVSNILSTSLTGSLNNLNGGISRDNINIGNIVIGNNKDTVIISSNLFWNIKNNSLNTENIILNNILARKYIGSGNNLSNIYSSNIINNVSIINGGLGINNIPYSYLIIGNDRNTIIATQNATFKNSNLYSINLLSDTIINNNINSLNSLYSSIIESKYLGNGINISNINASNLINSYILYNNGGTNTNYIKQGNLLYQNSNPTEFLDHLFWDNDKNILIINSNIISKNINSSFIGDGLDINNIISSNINGHLSIENGGLGCNLIPLYNLLIGNNKTLITTEDLSFVNKTLIVNGIINASNFYGNFIGTSFIGNDYTKLYASNLIDNISMINGGLDLNNKYGRLYFGANNNVITSSNITWSLYNKSLNINGNINISKSNYLYSKYLSSNIINNIGVNNGGLGVDNFNNKYILYGNNNSVSFTSNLIWINNKLLTKNINSSKIIGKLSGDAYNLSNINATKLNNKIDILNGGTGNTYFEYGNILLGNSNNTIIGSSKLNWNDRTNKLTILGDIIPSGNKIYSKFYGDGDKITNILLDNNNLLGKDNIENGLSGRNFFMSNQILIGNYKYPILTSKKFVWDNVNKNLNITGSLYSKRIYTNVVYNIVSSNLSDVLRVGNWGTGVDNINKNYIVIGNNSNSIIQSKNIRWINDKNILSVNGNINSKNYKGKLIGNAYMLSNLLASNINYNLRTENGGLGNKFFKKNNILIGNYKGNHKDIIYNTDSLSFIDKFYVNKLYNNSISIDKIIGDGLNVSNLDISKFVGNLDFINGGTSYNNIPYGNIFIGNNSNIPISSSNIIWSNNTLYIDNIDTINSIGSLYGNGENIINIIQSNIILETNIENGGLISDNINYGYILSTNNNKLSISSNLYWNNSNNILNINGTAYVNNIKIKNYIHSKSFQGSFIGDALNISNYQHYNFIHHLDVNKGGMGHNYINNGQLIIGNNSNTLITTPDLKWDNIEKSLIINNSNSGWVKANTFNANYLYGDGQHLSNYIYYASNMVPSDMISVLNGCMGSNFHNYNQIIFGDDHNYLTSSCNLVIDNIYNNNLIVKGIFAAESIYASGGVTGLSYQGKFYGDGISLSNIYSSNLSGAIPIVNYGTGYSNIIPEGQLLVGNDTNTIITTSNLTYDIYNSVLKINGGIDTKTFSSEINTNISNIICSNRLSITNKASYNYLYGDSIYSSEFIGDGINISNIFVNNLLDLNLLVPNGGLGCNLLPLYQILIGNNDNSIYSSENFIWNNDLLINGNINSCNIFNNNITGSILKSSYLYGDGNNISNILVSSIIDTLPVLFGGTSSNYIDNGQILIGNNSNGILTTSNLIWDENSTNLYINGTLITITISSTNISCSNLLTSNNVVINENSYYNSIKTETIQSSFIGDGTDLSNINVKNMSAISLPSYYGGSGSNKLDKGMILLGNNENPLIITSNLTWDNYNLNINGDIYIHNYYKYYNKETNILTKTIKASSYGGDGFNISNLSINNIAGVIDIKFGGTGKSNISLGNILVGNGSNTIIETSNLNWDTNNNILKINNTLSTISAYSVSLQSSNVYVNNNFIINNNSYYNYIYSKTVQGELYGDGIELSNININNIKRLNLNTINGGFGSNNLDKGSLIIGNDKESIIISSNLNWNDNILDIKGLLYSSNIITSFISTNTLVSSLFIGDGKELSNININNVANILLNINNGGTGYNKIDNGCILVGNNTNPLIFTSNFSWNDNKLLLNAKNIKTNIISIDLNINTSNVITSNIINQNGINNLFSNIYSSIIQSEFYGDGIDVSNIKTEEFKGSLSYLNGGTSCNILEYGSILIGNGNKDGILTNSELSWSNNSSILNINGDILCKSSSYNDVISKSVYSSYLYGDAANITNIVTKNIIGSFPVSASGTGCNILNYGHLLIGNENRAIILSSNLYWDDKNDTFNIKGTLNTSTSLSAVLVKTSNFNSKNFNASSVFYTNYFSNINSINTQGLLIGNAYNISNISTSKINSKLLLQSGGLSCNIINDKHIIIGNGNNSIITSSNLLWDYNNNILNINGDIIFNKFYKNNINNYSSVISSKINASYLYGDGIGLSNLNSDNFVGTFPVSSSGTGYNNIGYGKLLIGNNSNKLITTSNLIWDDNTLSFYTKGKIEGDILSFNSLITSNLITCNININNALSIFNSINTPFIESKFIGDGKNIRNVLINNIKDEIRLINGGTSSNILQYGNILYIENNKIVANSNIIFNNNILNINGNISSKRFNNKDIIKTKKINSSHIIGDGSDLININRDKILGSFNIINGGTGNNILEKNRLLIGNGINPLITSSNLYFQNNDLFIKGTLNITSIMSVSVYNTYDSITCNLKVSSDSIFNNLYSKYIQSKFNGDGSFLSNIDLKKINNMPRSINSNIITYGNIIVGSNSNNVILSSNLSWYNNNLYSTNINCSNLNIEYYNQSNIDVKNINIIEKYIINSPFYILLNISSLNVIGNFIPFNINNTLSSQNVNNYWNNNYFIPPVKGLYSIDYSVCTDTPCVIWINKGNNFSNNYNNRFGVKYVETSASINVVLDCNKDDNIYFATYSISGKGNILVNDLIGNTKASIVLLQQYK